jgi:hypothetical protein
MKKYLLIIGACALLGFGVVKHLSTRDDTVIKVSETRDTYHFSASFEEKRTMKVYRFINRSIKPNGLFVSDDDRLDVTTELSDKTRFHIKAYKGELEISFNKRENSKESYERIKTMCGELGEIVGKD